MEDKSKMDVDEQQLQHFDHEHPLMFKKEHVVGPPVSCEACGDPMLAGPCYSCDQCPNKYILHKSCAQLPKEIPQHPWHTRHPLILGRCRTFYGHQKELACPSCKLDWLSVLHKSCAIRHPLDSQQALNLEEVQYFECDACHAKSSGFRYVCTECDFTLDVKCAFNLRNLHCIAHFSHKHLLSLVTEEAPPAALCTGCLEQVLGPRYICRITFYGRERSCSSIVLHPSCVELPPDIKHPMHLHSLNLNMNRAKECHCDICDKDCSGRFNYTCFQCNFNIDLKCASQKGFQHFSHNHPLIIKKQGDKLKRESGTLVLCDGCHDPLHGPIYTCINTERRRKCRFNLHKSCAELPQEIRHPVHRQHPLLLNTFQDITVLSLCNACNQPCRYRYSCSKCHLNLHLKCAANWRNIIDAHEHQFSVPRYLHDPLTCDVCGESPRDSVYYVCSICQLVVDEECVSFPQDTTIPGHQHSLKLTWFLEDIFPNEDQVCNICCSNFEKCRTVYRCHDQECRGYVAHTKCMAVKYFQVDENQERTVNIDGDDYESDAREFNHFSHQHPLVSNDRPKEVTDEEDRLLTCQGCIRPITEAFYSCSKQEEESCHFYLHKTCAKFPKNLLLPFLHQHRYTLLSRFPSTDGVFQCSMCGLLHQGFVYGCHHPDLPLLDLECSTYSEYRDIKHESHVHRLLLHKEWDDVYCKGCGSKLIFCFSCSKRCDFHVCIACVKLPLTGGHRYDTHPLKLTYVNVEDEIGDYYCQICEGERNPAHWYYWCQECEFDFHPHCLIGRYPRVMLESTYKHDGHPQHLVSLVSKWKSPIPGDKRADYKVLPCGKCGEPCQGLVYECRECNINFHRDGCCVTKDPVSSRMSPQIEELS